MLGAAALAQLTRQIHAVAVGHAHVEDGEVEWLAMAHAIERFERRGQRRRAHAPQHREACQDAAIGLVIIDDQHALADQRRRVALQEGERAPAPASSTCSQTWNTEPRPGVLCTSTRPPINSARRLLMARPRPVPP